MPEQESINYNQIAKIIEYVKKKAKQPNLDEIVGQMNLSSFHLQRLFSEWAGTTAQKFLQYISIKRTQKLLTSQQVTLFDTIPSSTNYLHNSFINIEGMTPTEYKSLFVNYSFAQSPFGSLIVASTSKGVCYMAFEDNKIVAFNNLNKKFYNAVFQQKLDLFQQNALFVFQNDWDKLPQIRLHIKGTSFQLKVWEALLKIPMGELSTYGSIAKQISQPHASRAVGTAIGSNPVAFLIPCHRVIQASGNFGGYMWGNIRKMAIIGWEGAKINAKV